MDQNEQLDQNQTVVLNTPVITEGTPSVATAVSEGVAPEVLPLGTAIIPPIIPTPIPVSTAVPVPQTNIPDTKPIDLGGRPCEFCKDKDNLLNITNEYLESCNDKAKPRIPFIQELATLLDCGDKWTIHEWANKKQKGTDELEHPEFSHAIKKLKNMQETRLLQRTLGRYNPTGAIFQLKTNHKYIETEKVINAGDKDNPMELKVKIVEETKQTDI